MDCFAHKIEWGGIKVLYWRKIGFMCFNLLFPFKGCVRRILIEKLKF